MVSILQQRRKTSMFELIHGGNTKMFYSTDGIEEERCIGHMRFDFGSGEEFWHTWWPHAADEEHNTDLFKKELYSFIESLRAGLLRSASDAHKHINMLRLPTIEGDDSSYGCHVLTPQYAFFLRLNPQKGNYSYLYCYIRNEAEV